MTTMVERITEYMKISINDIPEDGLTVKANTSSDEWLSRVMDAALGNQFAKSDHAEVVATLLLFDENVDVRGDISFQMHPVCDRCLSTYSSQKRIPFHILMVPSSNKKRGSKEQDEDFGLEDVEFGYYKGDIVDLDDILREQILLEEPIKKLCSEDCKGICQYCGKNLNKGSCGCVEKRHDPRWDKLKDIKRSR